MAYRLLIKHGVGGRTFVDSARQPVDYQVEPAGEGWKFTVSLPMTEALSELLRLKDELNVFRFREEDGVAVEKNWYYTGDGRVRYDDQAQQLTIETGARITYNPTDYWA